ncbi:MAG: TonB-dependent receptor plug domain-containing protein [Gemmatimonadaceae bacterium]
MQTLPTVETRAVRDEQAAFEQKPNIGSVTISAKELTSAPRFFGEADILRAVRLLPGVNARNDYSVGMNVRGGEADQNLVLLDGYPIYNPFHMGGLFGAFVEPMVDRVTFITGGFPAQYGGRLSSVLDVRSAHEPRSGIHGRADLSFIASTMAIGSGMQDGQGSWVIAGRRTYADKVADMVKRGSLPYHFYDAQAHVVRRLPGDVMLSFTAYDNVDHLLEVSEDDKFRIEWGNRVLGTTLSRPLALGDSARVEQKFSWSAFDLDMDLQNGFLTLGNRVRDLRAAGSISHYKGQRSRTLGYEIGKQRYSFGANYPLLLYPSDVISNSNTTAGVFIDQLWRPGSRWLVQAGARFDAVSKAGTAIQPRVSAKYFVTPAFAFMGAYGEFAQWTHTLAREDIPIRALDFWIGSDSMIPISRARHFVLGAERWLTATQAVRFEGWYKDYPSLVEQNPRSDPQIPGDEFLELRGGSFGGDLMLRQLEAGRHSGWLAYSFSYSRRRSSDGAQFYPGQDRRHEANLVWNRRGNRYVFSTRFNLATGTPHTNVLGQYYRREYNPILRQFEFDEFPQFQSGERNAERLPLATRIDLSVTRRGRIGGVAVSPFLSLMNAYNAKNVFAYVYAYDDQPPRRIGLQQFPIFPTLGVSLAW